MYKSIIQQNLRKRASLKPKLNENKNFIIKKTNIIRNSKRKITRNDQVKINYFDIYKRNILKRMPNIRNVISNHELTSRYRSRMIDWLIDVFNNYLNTSDYTYFRATQLMDLYLYKTKTNIKNNDIYKIGITCAFIASKIEDISHIEINDFLASAGKDNFTVEEIKTLEFEILTVLNFKWSRPTILVLFDNLLVDNFDLNIVSYKILANIKMYAVFIMKILLMKEENYNYKIINLAAGTLIFILENTEETKNISSTKTIKKNILSSRSLNIDIVKYIYKEVINSTSKKYLSMNEYVNIKNPRDLKYYLKDFKLE